MRKPIHLSLGSALPTRTPDDALSTVGGGFTAQQVGWVSTEMVQVCPQNCGRSFVVDEEYLAGLQARFPASKVRLHANVRVLDAPCLFDLASMHRFPAYKNALVRVLRSLGQPYTLHAGRRADRTSLKNQLDRCRKLEDEAGIPVGIEALYPNKLDSLTASTWADYEAIWKSGVRYALDLSHLNIVRSRLGEAPDGLVREMLESPNCIEVHLSGNDGDADRHLSIDGEPFWWKEFTNARITADIFYEGRVEKEVCHG